MERTMMRNARTTSRRLRRRRGAALIEFLMVIPLIAVILSLTFFFGWGMRHQQKTRVADRYSCWRRLYCNQYPKHPHENRHYTLNELFFANEGGAVGTSGWHGPIDSLEEFVDATAEFGEQTQEMAEYMVLTQSHPFPKGRSSRVSANPQTDIKFWQKFRGTIHHRHTRDGKEWRRGQITYLEPIKDLFLYDLDEVFLSIDHPQLRENLRRLYLKRW